MFKKKHTPKQVIEVLEAVIKDVNVAQTDESLNKSLLFLVEYAQKQADL